MDDARKYYRLPGNVIGRTPLHAYQATDIVECARRPYKAIWHDPGLGKSIIALYTFLVLRAQQKVTHCIICCRHTHVDNWCEQIALHMPPDTTVRVLAGKPIKRRTWDETANIHIINFELLSRASRRPSMTHVELQDDARAMLLFLRAHKTALIIDESQAIKNPQANVTRALMALAPRAAHRYTLTGTPVAERPVDCWSQVCALDEGATLGTRYASFLERYAIMAKARNGHKFPVRFKNLDELARRLQPMSIRRRKEHTLNLPPKVRTLCAPAPGTAQKRLLRALMLRLLESLGALTQERFSLNVAPGPVSGTIQMLLRAAAVPWVVDPSVTQSAKIDAILQTLEDYPERMLVWCWHKDVAEAAAAAFTRARHKTLVINGDVPMTARTQLLNEFRGGKARVLLATMGCLAEGVTITECQRAAYLQMTWERMRILQSEDRIHRIGQTGTVLLEYYAMHGCLDHYLLASIKRKNIDADVVVDGAQAGDVVTRQSLVQYIKNELHTMDGRS